MIARHGKVWEIGRARDGSFDIVRVLYFWLPRGFVVEVALTRHQKNEEQR